MTALFSGSPVGVWLVPGGMVVVLLPHLVLTLHSQVFKDMRETATPGGAQPIDLDIPPKSVQCLLGMVLTDNDTCKNLDLNETVDLWRLTHKFEFEQSGRRSTYISDLWHNGSPGMFSSLLLVRMISISLV